jgi:FMN-dependent NADH-azoreductase
MYIILSENLKFKKMKQILHIISSPRIEVSASRKLGNSVLEKIQEKYPDSVVKERDLTKNLVPLLEDVHINSFFTPAESRSPEQETINQYSEGLI